MRIAMVGPFGLSPKGTMRVRAMPLARALSQEGHQVLVTMPAWHTPNEPARRWQEDSVWIEYVSLAPRIPLVGIIATIWRLFRHVLAWQPEVVHCFKPKAYSGLVAWLIWHTQRLGIYRGRLVIDEDDWEGPGGWNSLEPYGPLLKAFFGWQERWGLAHCDAITAASLTLQSLVWACGIHPNRVAYLPNGTFPRATGDRGRARRKLNLGQRPTILLYTRFFEYDPARAVAVVERVHQVLVDARLLVVGQGLFPEQEQKFCDLVDQAGLTDCIVKTGWVPMEELDDLFAASDVAIFPFDDTLVNRTKCSVKLIDLLAAGVPVIADRVGQNAAYISHNETGLLCEPENATMMADLVIRVLRDAALRERLSRQATEQMLNSYHWKTLAKRALAAYAPGTSKR